MCDEEQLREPEDLRDACIRKLGGVEISDYYLAILGVLLEIAWGKPVLAEMAVMSNRTVLARSVSESSFSQNLGHVDHIIKVLHAAADLANFDADETGYLIGRLAGLKWFRYSRTT